MSADTGSSSAQGFEREVDLCRLLVRRAQQDGQGRPRRLPAAEPGARLVGGTVDPYIVSERHDGNGGRHRHGARIRS